METRGTRDVRKLMDQRITTKRIHAFFRSSRAPRDQLETNCIFVFVSMYFSKCNFRTACSSFFEFSNSELFL